MSFFTLIYLLKRIKLQVNNYFNCINLIKNLYHDKNLCISNYLAFIMFNEYVEIVFNYS